MLIVKEGAGEVVLVRRSDGQRRPVLLLSVIGARKKEASVVFCILMVSEKSYLRK